MHPSNSPNPTPSRRRLITFPRLLAVVMFVFVSVLFIRVNAEWIGVYGFATFVGIPIACGLLAAYIVGESGTLMENVILFVISAVLGVMLLATVGAALLVSLAEGMLCIAMAIPIALPFLAAGLAVGWIVKKTVTWTANKFLTLATILSIAPLMMGVELAIEPIAPVYEVKSFIDVAAPPETVWQNVVTFPPLDEPTEFMFRAGIAYPMHATIDREGAGAIRRCIFNTGDFVEPIEIWEPPCLLRFAVIENASPMIERGLFGPIDTPHLHGYMESKRGQFRLVPLADGGTRIEGTTWYSHGLYPAWYWRLWSDHIIHGIHMRVLNHIKEVSEAATR
ncbi:MAG: hypothetical protein HUU46_11460 [Candidatus Hydrogenedentes bacterium]|nr:hypothetical protein [Candidatus Hydrogenedentota bacterium]